MLGGELILLVILCSFLVFLTSGFNGRVRVALCRPRDPLILISVLIGMTFIMYFSYTVAVANLTSNWRLFQNLSKGMWV